MMNSTFLVGSQAPARGTIVKDRPTAAASAANGWMKGFMTPPMGATYPAVVQPGAIRRALRREFSFRLQAGSLDRDQDSVRSGATPSAAADLRLAINVPATITMTAPRMPTITSRLTPPTFGFSPSN